MRKSPFFIPLLAIFMLVLSACIMPAAAPTGQDQLAAEAHDDATAEPHEEDATAEPHEEEATAEPHEEEATAEAHEEEATAEPHDEEATAEPHEEEATAEPAEEAVVEPVVLRQGDFRDRDASHQGSGVATLVQNGDEQLLRLTDFDSSDGPDLFVWLVENPETLDADALGATLDLGLLQSLTGDQEYAIPAGTDLSSYQGVIIYCREFHFVFSMAPFLK